MSTDTEQKPMAATTRPTMPEKVNAILDILADAHLRGQKLTAKNIARRTGTLTLTTVSYNDVSNLLPDMIRRDWVIERINPERKWAIYELSELGLQYAYAEHICNVCSARCIDTEGLRRHMARQHTDAPSPPSENTKTEILEDIKAEIEQPKAIIDWNVYPMGPTQKTPVEETLIREPCCDAFSRLTYIIRNEAGKADTGNACLWLDAGIGTIAFCPYCGAPLQIIKTTYKLVPEEAPA